MSKCGIVYHFNCIYCKEDVTRLLNLHGVQLQISNYATPRHVYAVHLKPLYALLSVHDTFLIYKHVLSLHNSVL